MPEHKDIHVVRPEVVPVKMSKEMYKFDISINLVSNILILYTEYSIYLLQSEKKSKKNFKLSIC